MVPGQRQSIGVGWVQKSGFTSQKLAIPLTGNDIVAHLDSYVYMQARSVCWLFKGRLTGIV